MLPNTKRGGAGFTLVELMVTVAIVGVLAAAATTLYAGQQMRSKRAEGMTNTEALAKMAKGFFGDTGIYPAIGGAWPLANPTTAATQWDPASRVAFGQLGFSPEGAVRYAYDFDAGGECPCAGACFTAIAYSNLDGDGTLGGVGYFHRDGAGIECPTSIWGWFAPLDAGGVAQYDTAAPYLPSLFQDDF